MRYFAFGRLESIEVFSFLVKNCPDMTDWLANIKEKSFIAIIKDDRIIIQGIRNMSNWELKNNKIEDFKDLMALLYREFKL